MLPVIVFSIWRIAQRTLKRSHDARQREYVLFDALFQVLSGSRMIKAYRGEAAETKSAIEKGQAYFDVLIDIVRLRVRSWVLLETVTGLGPSL